MAYRHSQDADGKRTQQEEVEIIGCQTDRGVTTYIVRTQDGMLGIAIQEVCYTSERELLRYKGYTDYKKGKRKKEAA